MLRIDEKVETVGDLRQLVRSLGRLDVPDEAALKNQRTGGALHLSIEVDDDEPYEGTERPDEGEDEN